MADWFYWIKWKCCIHYERCSSMDRFQVLFSERIITSEQSNYLFLLYFICSIIYSRIRRIKLEFCLDKFFIYSKNYPINLKYNILKVLNILMIPKTIIWLTLYKFIWSLKFISVFKLLTIYLIETDSLIDGGNFLPTKKFII